MTDTAETMVERVMAALFRELRPDDQVAISAVGHIQGDEISYIDFGPMNVRDLARAAIASMAEPTEEMIDQGYEPIRYREVTTHRDAREAYRAMIQAALTEKPE